MVSNDVSLSNRDPTLRSFEHKKTILESNPAAGGRAFSALDCYAGGLPIESDILPLLKHTCGEQQLATMLAINRLAGVTPEMNESQGMYIMYASAMWL